QAINPSHEVGACTQVLVQSIDDFLGVNIQGFSSGMDSSSSGLQRCPSSREFSRTCLQQGQKRFQVDIALLDRINQLLDPCLHFRKIDCNALRWKNGD